MNKRALIEAVAEHLDSRPAAAEAVEAVFDVVIRTVTSGETVSVTGFGSITPRALPARTARNPRDGSRVQLAATRVPRFRPGTNFRDLVAGRKPLPQGSAVKKAPKTPRP